MSLKLRHVEKKTGVGKPLAEHSKRKMGLESQGMSDNSNVLRILSFQIEKH